MHNVCRSSYSRGLSRLSTGLSSVHRMGSRWKFVVALELVMPARASSQRQRCGDSPSAPSRRKPIRPRSSAKDLQVIARETRLPSGVPDSAASHPKTHRGGAAASLQAPPLRTSFARPGK